jgi:ubiquinone/menaquinone biosynthesis C-methylase UbiE
MTTTPDANVNSFDERALTWDDDPAKVERANAVAAAIRQAIPLTPTMAMLEYGAGTGLVTQALRDAVGPVTLADTSEGMRNVLARKIEAGTIADARISDVDLAAGPLPDERFDLIVTVMTLHHITELDAVLTNFAALLNNGGHLCIVDLEAEDGSFHGDGFHGHHGFDRDALAEQLTSAGFTGIDVRRCFEIHRESASYPLFLATSVIQHIGRTPSS